ncbi:hypothetical protein J6590_037909 [Homalodisca vitripennis]|nr:hypothetical protein J6590_037909 [Homalodisca vitripennis]
MQKTRFPQLCVCYNSQKGHSIVMPLSGIDPSQVRECRAEIADIKLCSYRRLINARLLAHNLTWYFVKRSVLCATTGISSIRQRQPGVHQLVRRAHVPLPRSTDPQSSIQFRLSLLNITHKADHIKGNESAGPGASPLLLACNNPPPTQITTPLVRQRHI